jgi:signal transduction histidine kinase/CheY-like chemotaxis protein
MDSVESTASLTSAEPGIERAEFQELRVNALQRLLRAAVVVGLLWYAYVGLVLDSIELSLWSGPLLLVLFGFLTQQTLARWGYMPAALLFLLGSTLTVLVTTWATGNAALLLLLALPAGIAGLLLGTQISVLFAFCATLALVWAMRTAGQDVQLAGLTIISIWLTTLLIWVAVYPLRMTADWAWASFEQARRKTEQARTDRAQLARVLKELDSANGQLQSMTVELERARRAAVEARRLKAEFAANISHELRTPLNLIIGFSEMMTLAPETYGTPLPPAYRGDVHAIFRNARHLADLVDDVLDLSQLEAGRMGLLRAPLDVGDVIQEAVDTVASLFQRKQLALHLHLAPDLPQIDADRTRVRQVLINLLNNAARFTEQGSVTLAAHAGAQEVHFTVTDTGPGIAPEMLPHVFEEFSWLNARVRDQHGGSGLGMAVSKKFVELHGGHMGVTARLGQGTTFSFSLPLREELGIKWQPPSWETWVRLPPREGRRKKTLALLAPDAPTAHLFARYLEEYEVVTVPDRAAAWQLASRTLVHALLVVADGGEAGWMALRTAREGLPPVPVLVCTLRGGPTARRPAHATVYLTKPVSQAHFLATLDQLDPSVRRLLIVDDEPEVVRLLSRMAQRAARSFEITRAYSGARALEIMAHQPPDALILDLLMPDIDGYTVMERLRSRPEWQTLPIIIVTARGREEEKITTGLVGLTQRDGFSIGETVRCLKANLDALLPPAVVEVTPDAAVPASTAGSAPPSAPVG